MTWQRQEPLAATWTLLIPSRRGFSPSPPVARQDFERDAADLVPLLGDGGAHLAGFSYGGVGAALAALSAPDRVRSLTLIETPLYSAAPDDPEVARLAAMGDSFLAGAGSEGDEREFLRLAGLEGAGPEHADEIAEAVAAARGGRPPSEAEVDFDAIRDAPWPVLVVSGGHNDAIERLSGRLAEWTGGTHQCVAGAGHPAQRAAGFNAVFEDFLRAAEPEPEI
jgi:pimeloyl-ACP methyl ester carboxylesterase